jgi:[protein-PII] uridylyltransferase
MSQLATHVLTAKARLADGHQRLKEQHQAGSGGTELCGGVSDLRDAVLLDLFEARLEDLDPSEAVSVRDQIALVVHGGHGRREVSPFSDVDLMVLRRDRDGRIDAVARRLFRDVFDSGLALGHSIRTPDEACRLACQDACIATSLMESRLLAGDEHLFRSFVRRFDGRIRRRRRALMAAIEVERMAERARFGETVYLLEPNVKRSRGGLRDLQFLRWIAGVRYGARLPEELAAWGLLSEDDHRALKDALENLLWLRNELHFHAGKPNDVLDRSEQLRIADRLGYPPATGMLPVERFMRGYFRHTDRVSHVIQRFVAQARFRGPFVGVTTALFGHRVEGGFYVGPTEIAVTPAGSERIRRDLAAVMQLIDLANLYTKPIEAKTWELVRREADISNRELSPAAIGHFKSLLSLPGGLGPLARLMHEIGLLEKFIPAFSHARGLLQFNHYHKYTVDEHCLRALEVATGFHTERGLLGEVYRRIRRKHVLHLALLLHDLGKGHPEDHCKVGAKIAGETARRLGWDGDESTALEFLVDKHLLMNHLALRRDVHDEQLVVRFAVEVGSAELLRMLFVMTAADLDAVGPGTWDGWKAELLGNLYQRTLGHLTGEGPAGLQEEQLPQRRERIGRLLPAGVERRWLDRQLRFLPAGYLAGSSDRQIAAELAILRKVTPGDVIAQARWQPETETVRITVGTREDVTAGIFHKLTGALAARGLGILSAEIVALADGLVLDRFQVVDPDYAGRPPDERLSEITSAVQESLTVAGDPNPSFRQTLPVGRNWEPKSSVARTRVKVDNSTSADCTVLDIFAADRPGLLYRIARALHEAGLYVQRARIGTVMDQVVDVFYVTDEDGNKIENEFRLQEIRGRLMEVLLAKSAR